MNQTAKPETGIKKGMENLSQWLAYCAGGFLLAMMVLVNANVLLRPLGLPIWGAYELVGFLGSLTLSLALFKITMNRGHMAVEVVTSRLPRGLRRFLGLLERALGTAVFALVAWRSACLGWEIWRSGEVSPTLSMPFHPFVFGVALAFGVSALAMLLDLVRYRGPEEK
jgi:TRAP-type C4-dicarboxylate transport system permease small subunit